MKKKNEERKERRGSVTCWRKQGIKELKKKGVGVGTRGLIGTANGALNAVSSCRVREYNTDNLIQYFH